MSKGESNTKKQNNDRKSKRTRSPDGNREDDMSEEKINQRKVDSNQKPEDLEEEQQEGKTEESIPSEDGQNGDGSEEQEKYDRYKQEMLEFFEIGKEIDEIYKEFVDGINYKNPSESDYENMRRILSEPRPITRVSYISQCIQDFLIESSFPSIVHQLSIKDYINHILEDMDYANADRDERLLIDNIINCWVRLQYYEKQLSNYLDFTDIRILEFWDKRLIAAQRRFRQACLAHARYKKLKISTALLKAKKRSKEGQHSTDDGDVVTPVTP